MVISAPQIMLAQPGTIRGTVETSDGHPVEYVNIGLEGTGKGVSTDIFGHFEIPDVNPGTYFLRVSSVGLESQEQEVTIREGEILQVDFTLRENTRQLREVVISSVREKYTADELSPTLRITTPVLEMPQNVQIITGSVISDQQAFDMLEGIQRNISGAQKVEHWDNYARINMRGSQITPFRNGMNVQLSPWSPLTEDMSMVERIEFVKGPAGFMLANGEPGGFYNVVTKKPTGIEKGDFSISVGSFETYRSTLDLDGKLSADGRLMYRLNLMGQLKGSHRNFEYNNRYSIAPVLKYLIDEQSSITLEYNEQYSQMNVIGSNYAFSRRSYADLPYEFTTAEPNFEPSHMRDRNFTAIFEHKFDKDWKVTAQAAYLHFEQEGQSLWPWGISSANDSLMQRGISIWDAIGLNKNGQIFINGRTTTGGISHTLLAGLDMSHKDYYADWNQGAALGDSAFNIYHPRYGLIPAAEIPEWDRSKDVRERGVRYNNSYTGIYFQDELGFFENKFRLTLAGRYTANNYINPYSGSSEDGKFTPRVGLSWSITPSTSTYALYDQVFLANPGTDWQGNNFDPITGENMEWGLKKNWFGGKWNSVLALYRITKNNMLVTDLEHPDPVSGQFIYSKQTGQQQVKGVELDVRGEIIPNLEVVVNYAYTDARITEDTNPEVVGNRVPGATEHIQNTWLNYRIGSGILNGLRFSLGYQYQAGRSSWFIFDNTENSLPDYFRLDGGVGYQADRFNVNLMVNNILNDYLYSGAPYGEMFYWQTEPPRNFRLTVGYAF
ncbi:MAG: TonB-dependent receptor [Cyclobacteriaceae bacterium]|nr:TonB-dependent receptor [Cyclobacteriaceae bacterium]